MEQNTQPPQYGIVLVTASSQTEAEAIAQTLVQEQLAACVSFTPIHSIYIWQGNLESAQEWQLILKTDLQLFARLQTRIQELHSYKVPEIIALPILTGSPSYLSWISANLKT